jgi:hypothetical protein
MLGATTREFDFRGRIWTLALCVLALGLAGCQLRAEVDVALDRAGGGLLSVVVGADQELLAKATEAGVDPLEVLTRQRRALADAGWEVSTQQRDGGGRQVRLSAEFDGPDELEILTAELANALAAPEVRPLEPFTVVVTDDQIMLSGAGGIEFTPATTALGIDPADATRRLQLQDAVVYEVRVRLPGELISASGTERTPGVVVWEIRPGERVDIRAVSERPGRPLLEMVLAATVAVIASSVAVIAVKRRARARIRV